MIRYLSVDATLAIAAFVCWINFSIWTKKGWANLAVKYSFLLLALYSTLVLARSVR